MTKRVLCLLPVLLLASRVAQADSISVGDTITFAGPLGNSGGSGIVVTANEDPTTSYVSFCMQMSVGGPNDFSTTMLVAGISDYATNQPVDQGGDEQGRDFLTSQTAWLYTQFRLNGLTGFDGSKSAYDSLSWAIWQLQGEASIPQDDSPESITPLANSFIALADDAVASGYTGIGDVRVLNLVYQDGSDAQDQLTLVPEPSSLELLGLGMVALFAVRRRQWLTQGQMA
jgi:PEP-CTERM motif